MLYAVLIVAALAGGQATPVVEPGAAGAVSLREAVDEALRNSPELQPQSDQVSLADIQRRAAASRFALKVTPSLNAMSGDGVPGAARSLDVTVAKQLVTGTQIFAAVSSSSIGTAGTPMRDAAYRVGISQPLLRGFGATAAALEDAKRGVERAHRELAAARAALIVRTSAAYFGVIKEERLAAIARQAAERAATLKRASSARATAGLATQLDVLRAELLEAQLSAAVAAQDQAVMTARDSLRMLLGRPAAAPIAVVDDAAVSARAPQLPAVEALVASARSTRPELREVRDRIDDARRAASIAKWNLLPPLSLDVSYARHGIGVAGGGVLNDLMGGWRVGLSSAYALDRGSERAAVEASQLTVVAAERAARLAEQRIELEVRQLYRSCEAADARIALSRQAVALAERQLRLAELRFERGLATSLEVVDAQTSVLQTANALAAAEMDRAVLTLDVQRAAGTLTPGDLR